MLSDEERKIETLKKYINSQEQKMNDYYKIDEEFYKDEIEQLEFSIKLLRYILNLIEKQSKEIEELKEKNKKYTIHFTDKQYSDAIKLAQSVAISMFERKIKAKIEEEDELFFKTKDVRHANRYKAYKELLEKE